MAGVGAMQGAEICVGGVAGREWQAVCAGQAAG